MGLGLGLVIYLQFENFTISQLGLTWSQVPGIKNCNYRIRGICMTGAKGTKRIRVKV